MGLLYNEHGNSRNRHIAFRPCCRVSATGHLSFGADADRRFRDSIHRLVPDVYNTWSEIWQKLKWALMGIGIFLISWVWALASSLAILAESKEAKQ